MSEDTTELSVEPGDPRVQAVVGLVLVALAMAGLSLEGEALMLQQWARWFAMTGLFFFGMAFTMRALTMLD